jgi:MTH538 TIR-like domain (DUF1863)
MQKHKTFVSFHSADMNYKNLFVKKMTDYTDGMVDKSVSDGDIDPNTSVDNISRLIRENFLAQSTVTVVLIGAGTWRRKHVDWEISYSLRATNLSSRNGLIGILLPTYPRAANGGYYKNSIPPRLADNIDNGFANIYNWSEYPFTIQGWIHEAFVRRDRIIPDNSRQLFANNRPDSQLQWQD